MCMTKSSSGAPMTSRREYSPFLSRVPPMVLAATVHLQAPSSTAAHPVFDRDTQTRVVRAANVLASCLASSTVIIGPPALPRGPSRLWLGHARALVPKHLDRRNRAPAICIMRNECRYHHPAQLAHSAPPSAQHKHCNRAERYRPYPPHSSGSSFVPASMLAWL